jgi:DNA-binding MarR family transcriptional regulator
LNDRRRIRLQVTAKGHQVLRVLSEDHEREINELGPTLIQALSRICGHDKRATGNRGNVASVHGD